MLGKQVRRAGKRYSHHINLVSDIGFGKFLNLLHSSSSSGIISLGVGEPDFKTPWHICEAGFNALKKRTNRIHA